MANKAKKEIPNRVIGALADAFDKSYKTISRWIATDDDRLTSQKAREVYAQQNFTWNDEILEGEPIKA